MSQKELNSKLLEAAEKGDTDTMWELVKQGADINARDQWGKTALIVSAQKGRLTPKLLEAFVSIGADINARDEWGRMALMWSALKGHLTPELLEALVSRGADINASDENGMTALMWSSAYNHLTPELLDKFMEHGTDINARDEDSETALSLVLDEGCGNDIDDMERILMAFLRHGARIDFNEQYIQGLLPAVVRYLLETTESCPSLAVKIIREQPEGMLEQWLEQGVPGTEELLAKAAFMLGKNQKDRNGEFVVMEF